MKQNALIGTIISCATMVIMAVAGFWINTSNRIAILETQQKVYQENYDANSAKMDNLLNSVNEIQENITQMRGEMKLKADKKLID